MRKAGLAVIAATITWAAPAHAGTSFQSTWRAPDAKPGSFQGKKVVALFINQEEALRRGIEWSLAGELTRRGAQGIPAYSLIPTTDLRDEAKAKTLIQASGAVGLVAFRLVGSEQEVSSSPAMYWSAPSYSTMWGGYWGYGWGGVYAPGYVRTEKILLVETLVYSLEQNKLVWAGQSKSTNPKDAQALVKTLVDKVANEMKKQGLLEKGK